MYVRNIYIYIYCTNKSLLFNSNFPDNLLDIQPAPVRIMHGYSHLILQVAWPDKIMLIQMDNLKYLRSTHFLGHTQLDPSLSTSCLSHRKSPSMQDEWPPHFSDARWLSLGAGERYTLNQAPYVGMLVPRSCFVIPDVQ